MSKNAERPKPSLRSRRAKTAGKSAVAPKAPPTRAGKAAAIRPDLAGLLRDLLARVRRINPAAAAVQNLAPGQVGPELPFDPTGVRQLFTAAATQGNPGTQIWTKDDSELLVLTAQVNVSLSDGLVLVTIPVSCDQVPSALIQVPFVVGAREQPTGMICATEERPRGPDIIVSIWAEALTAFAWQAFLAVATKAAAGAGTDQDGAPLVPVAITASRDGVRILTMARHAFDRVKL